MSYSFAFFAIFLGVIWIGHCWYARKRDTMRSKAAKYGANAQSQEAPNAGDGNHLKPSKLSDDRLPSTGSVSPEQLLEDVINSRNSSNHASTTSSQQQRSSTNVHASHFEVI
jgi:hypothetical protein